MVENFLSSATTAELSAELCSRFVDVVIDGYCECRSCHPGRPFVMWTGTAAMAIELCKLARLNATSGIRENHD
jgi:hypothetical protein